MNWIGRRVSAEETLVGEQCSALMAHESVPLIGCQLNHSYKSNVLYKV